MLLVLEELEGSPSMRGRGRGGRGRGRGRGKIYYSAMMLYNDILLFPAFLFFSLFDSLISWTSILTGCGISGLSYESFEACYIRPSTQVNGF